MSSLSTTMLSPPKSPNSCGKYFKVGSTTRRYSVIGCIGYENANPSSCIPETVETVEIGVGTFEGEGEEITCAICLECLDSGSGSGSGCAPQKKNIATTECGHTFCLSCLLKHLHHSNLCPLCRAPVEQNIKHVLKPLSYSDGIGLLDHGLNGLRIVEEVEQFVQNAMEISADPNTNGQNIEDVVGDIVTMVTNFGFHLLYDAALHSSGSEAHMDNEWIIQMYDDDDDDTNSGSGSSDSSDSSINDYNTDSDADDADDESGDRPILPEVPAWMFE